MFTIERVEETGVLELSGHRVALAKCWAEPRQDGVVRVAWLSVAAPEENRPAEDVELAEGQTLWLGEWGWKLVEVALETPASAGSVAFAPVS